MEPVFRGLPLQHPRPDQVAELAKCRTHWAREAFVRLWLTEGVPYVFRECPEVYEDIRGWLGNRLHVCPKEITMIGSARLGYSLAPPPKYGAPFGASSDLDIAVASAGAFRGFCDAFQAWKEDYRSGSVKPRHQTEERYWDANLGFFENNMIRGFVDANKLPTLDRYPISQQYNSAMWALTKKLQATPGAPLPTKASVRVYQDWRCLVSRVAFNLRWVLQQLG